MSTHMFKNMGCFVPLSIFVHLCAWVEDSSHWSSVWIGSLEICCQVIASGNSSQNCWEVFWASKTYPKCVVFQICLGSRWSTHNSSVSEKKSVGSNKNRVKRNNMWPQDLQPFSPRRIPASPEGWRCHTTGGPKLEQQIAITWQMSIPWMFGCLFSMVGLY